MNKQTLYYKIIPKTSKQKYLSKWYSLNLTLDKYNNGADWHYINHFCSYFQNKEVQLSTDEYNLGNKGILKRKMSINEIKNVYYVASYARAAFELLHFKNTYDPLIITELMFNKHNLKELKKYFKKHNCELCKEYLIKELEWN